MIQNEYIFTHLTTTKIYYYFIIFQLVLTALLAIMIFTLSDRVFVLETILASMLAIDLIIRYLSRGHEKFWENWSNVIDSSIVTVLLLLLFIETLFEPQRDFEELSTVVLFLRYGMQVYRLSRLLRQQKESRDIQNMPPIDLDFDSQNLEEKGH